MYEGNEKQLIELEKQFWDAMRNHDPETATRLCAEKCVVVGPQGIGEIDRETLGRMIEKPGYELTRYDLDDRDLRVRAISDDVAIVAYKVHEDLVVDETPLSMQAFESSVWVRHEGAWECVMHSECLPGDPFGRRDVDTIHAGHPQGPEEEPSRL